MKVEITIPNSLTKDFIGSMVLDIIHDAKGRGILNNKKLCEITDLLSYCFFEECNDDHCHEQCTSSRNCKSISGRSTPTIFEEDKPEYNCKNDKFKNFLFSKAFMYFYELWQENPSALGKFDKPDFNNLNIEYYRNLVFLPIRQVGDSFDNDTFSSLGRNRKGIESENYLRQSSLIKNKINFVSPKTNIDFYNKAKELVQFIKIKSKEDSLVSLDMKCSGGLLRTITDGIGYISSLATYSDPGYNMAGMSAIRNNSVLHFNKHDKKEFSYTIKLETNFGVYTFFNIQYFWGNIPNNSSRENLMIRILDSYTHNSLPKARESAEALERYLNSKSNETVWTSKEVLGEIELQLKPNIVTKSQELANIIYHNLHHKTEYIEIFKNLFNLASIKDIKEVSKYLKWADNSIKVAYLVETLKNYINFNFKSESNSILPEDILILLPNILEVNLPFCWIQLNLIKQYIVSNLDDSKKVEENLNKLKATDKRTKFLNEFDKKIDKQFQYFKDKLINNNIEKFLTEKVKNPKKEFLPNKKILEIAKEFIPYFIPQYLNENIDNNILLYSLLNLVKELEIYPETFLTVEESVTWDTLRSVLGKFSGDFGQIIWCLSTGNIFATEDNNTSAIACILHRIDKRYIVSDFPITNKWVNIHGHGDGGQVDIIYN